MIGTIDDWKLTHSGYQFVKIDGKWHTALVDFRDVPMKTGIEVEYEVGPAPKQYPGAPYVKIKPINKQDKYMSWVRQNCRFAAGEERYDFNAGNEKARNMSTEELRFALKDLKETIKIQEESAKAGMHTPKLGYYWDELSTYLGELKRRQDILADSQGLLGTG